VRTGPLALWDPVADCRSGSLDTRDCEYCQSWGVTEAVARRGRIVSAGREGQDDLVVKVWRAVRPKRLIGSLNRDTGVSPWGKVPMLRTGDPSRSLRRPAGIVERSKKRGQCRLALTSSLSELSLLAPLKNSPP
jgi:hypothetical protein